MAYDLLEHYKPVVIETEDEELNHTSFSKPVIFFYGGPFSNFDRGPFIVTSTPYWAEAPVTLEYPSMEAFLQAEKAAYEFDHRVIREADSPGAAKMRGNSHQSWEPGYANRSLLRPDWDERGEDGLPKKYHIFLVGARVKYAQPHYRVPLLGTGDCIIAEDSPTDFIWGIRDERRGFTGENLLGKALMQVRKEIREEAEPCLHCR
jgi:ribA/ribD-fused uncharacterized protein